ncbi:permease prefix domain 1-containing protein [Alkalihalobacillus sp. 1P02AB]|uniref:permease prefix domain 1-containing protein n=1 Tax=Alkalihalobacillus sp. 1P02AB TaxID=3132260 RepID=UPI0039A75539
MTTKSFDAFLTRVTEQMKSKEGKHLVQKELYSHLQQSKKANMRAGYSDEEAEVNAISRMGDPVQLGRKMNKLHRPLIDWWMLALVGGLFLLSFVPFLLVDIQAMRVETQLFSVLLSFICIMGLMFFDFRHLIIRWKWFLALAAAYILLFLVGSLFNMPFIYNVYGLEKLYLFGLRIPHQWFIFFLFIGLVGFLAFARITSFKKTWPLFMSIWSPVFLLGNDLGPFLTLLHLVVSFMLIIFSSLNRELKSHFLWVNAVISGAFVILLLLFMRPHHYDRIYAVLRMDSGGSSWIYERLTDIIVASSWFGQKDMSWITTIPDIHTITALAIVIYYGGWLLTGLLMLIFMAIVIRFFWLFIQLQYEPGRLLLVGGIVIIFFPFLYNTLMIFGLLPYTGVNFPILSYGGAEKVFYSVIIGLMLSVYRRKLFLQKGALR